MTPANLISQVIEPDLRTTSTMPFGRPHFNEILQSPDFVIPKNYPARRDA